MKKRVTLSTIRRLDKAFRYPFAMTFLAISLFFIYLTSRAETVYLPTEVTPVSFYSNQTGDNLRKILRTAILQAKESVMVMIFSLSDYEIIDALRQKASEGVQVILVQDAVATNDID